MNDLARRMVMDRQRRRRDYEQEDYAYEDRRRRRNQDYEMRRRDMRLSDPIGTEPEYPQEMWDGKQGVKGTGPYGIGGRLYSRGRDYADYDDYGYEDRPRRNSDYGYDDYVVTDGAHPSGLMHLKKKDMMKWKKDIQNADGTRGEHFGMEQIEKAAQQLGIKYEGYDEKELCMTVNMLYSDFCEAIKMIRPDLPPEKEVVAYTKLAQAWLEDKDAPVDGSEKLALYYWCIVNDEE
jgi:hypothetical protein